MATLNIEDRVCGMVDMIIKKNTISSMMPYQLSQAYRALWEDQISALLGNHLRQYCSQKELDKWYRDVLSPYQVFIRIHWRGTFWTRQQKLIEEVNCSLFFGDYDRKAEVFDELVTICILVFVALITSPLFFVLVMYYLSVSFIDTS